MNLKALFGIWILMVSYTSQAQSKKDWKKLFNGRNLQDWIVKIHHHDYNENYGNTFSVEKKKIKVSYDQYGEFNEQYGHLYYKTPFALLNSGVMYHSQDPASIPKEQDWPISVEMQFLAGLGDGKPRPTCNMCSPGTEIEYQGQNILVIASIRPVNRYDPAFWNPGKPLKEGFIALQSEGQPVEFRDIKLLNLKGCMDPSAKNYKNYYVGNDASSCKF